MAISKGFGRLTDLPPLEQQEIQSGFKELLGDKSFETDAILFYFSTLQKELYFMKVEDIADNNFDKCITATTTDAVMNCIYGNSRWRYSEWERFRFADPEQMKELEKMKEAFPYTGLDEMKNWYEESRYNYRRYAALPIPGSTWDDLMTLKYLLLYTKAPQIEQLVKGGFQGMVYSCSGSFARYYTSKADIDLFLRNFKKGKNLSEITGLPNFAIKLLSDSAAKENLRLWNEYRIWIQKEKLAKEGLETLLSFDLNNSSLFGKMRKLCNATFEGEKIYNINTLITYLERVDMYQAISNTDAIAILEDYFRMCRQMGVRPVKDSNSLKREHDVTARNHRDWMIAQREEFDKEIGTHIKNRAEFLGKYAFEDENYTVVIPTTVQDFINEGNQNHNCVGSYAHRFAEGKSNIFFVRKKENPEHSYITVELTGDCTSYRQAFLSSNQRITADADWDFINHWIENNDLVNKGKVKVNEKPESEYEPDYYEQGINSYAVSDFTDALTSHFREQAETEARRSINEQLDDATVKADAHNKLHGIDAVGGLDEPT